MLQLNTLLVLPNVSDSVSRLPLCLCVCAICQPVVLLLYALLEQVPVKDKPGNMVITYNMDVRTEPVETLMGNNNSNNRQQQTQQQGNYSRMPEWGNQQEAFERAMSNGRVPANAW